MRVEVPKFKRCCFCVPLRYGLLVWGYLRIILPILMLTGFILLYPYVVYGSSSDVEIVIYTTLIILLSVDIIFNVLFLVAAHMKSYKILKVYYYYSIYALVIPMLFYLFPAIMQIQRTLQYFGMRIYVLMLILQNVIVPFLYTVLQLYFLFMLKSEIFKLEDNHQFRFVNHAAEAECVMSEVLENQIMNRDTERDNDTQIVQVTMDTEMDIKAANPT